MLASAGRSMTPAHSSRAAVGCVGYRLVGGEPNQPPGTVWNAHLVESSGNDGQAALEFATMTVRRTNTTPSSTHRKSRVRRMLIRGAIVGAAASVVGSLAIVEPATALPPDCMTLVREAQDDMRWSTYYRSVGDAFASIGARDEAEVSYSWSSAYRTLADDVVREARAAGCGR